MSTIQSSKGIVTQINVFTCEPENQEKLIEVLIESAKTVCDAPGWLSANIHRSFDGRQVVNYAQCKSMEAQEHVVRLLREQGRLDKNKLFGEAHPYLYEVVFTLNR